MHFKQKAYSFGVPLLYALTITLSSVGRCGPTAHFLRPTSHSAFYDDRSGFLTTRGLKQPISDDTRWFHLGSRRGEGHTSRRSLPRSNTAGAAGPERRLQPRMAPSNGGTRFKRRPAEGEWLFNSNGFLDYGNCSEGFVKHVVPGTFYVPGQFEPSLKELGHQVDSVQVRGGQAGIRAQQPRGLDESWLRLEPTVECGEDAMILTVRRKRVMQLLLDRANESSLLLFQLPPQCGYSVQTTERQFSLKAQYDACHVAREGDSHVLPLLWRGMPVKVTCPMPQISRPGQGPALCCSQHGMTIKLQGSSAVEDPRINVRGDWSPLSLLAKQCGYTLYKQHSEIIVAVPFASCGVTVKDEKQTLSLQTGRRIYTLACSIPPLTDLPVTNWSLADSPDLTTHKQESFGPLLWIPPFYLAPPNYPHPTHPQLKGHNSFNVPTEAVFVSQPKHKERYYHQISPKKGYEQRPPSSKHQKKDLGRVNQNKKKHRKDPISDLSDNSISPTRFTVVVETPPPQPPGHDFSSYYHYYHLPKIPLPGAPQDSSPGPGVSGGSQLPTDSQDEEFPSLIPNNEGSESNSKGPSDTTSQPMTTPSSLTFPTNSKVSAVYAAYPPQYFPHYYYYYYFPHISKGEAKRLGLFHPDLAGKTNLSLVHLPQSSGRSGHENKNPDTNKMDKTDSSKGQSASVTPAVHQSYSLKPTPLSVPPPEQTVFPTPGFTYNADPYKYYYHPYYNYYQMYYGPDALSGKYNLRTVTKPKAAASQTSPTSESIYNIPKSLYPYYYYYYLYYLPQMLKYSQKLRSQGSKDAKKPYTGSDSQLSSNVDYSEMQQSAPALGQSSVPFLPYNPLQSLYSGYNTQQPPTKPLEQHSGQRVKEKQGKENRDTAGQYFVFGVPDSVADPSVAPPSEDRRSCMQKLTTQPDIYIVPMEGCGVNKHMSGETMVHQLEVQGIQSDKDGGSSPVRLMVGCSSSPESPGEVRFHMLDQPSPPSTKQTLSPVTVLLRIATDESFISFYPEAHLPLSLLQDKPVYVELKLLQPSETSKVLLVHSCLAYTLAPELRWLLFYDSCSSPSISQLLPSSDSNHIRRIRIARFPSLPMESSTYKSRGRSALKDPEIYFLCLTELCSAAHGDCGSCNKGPSSDVRVK